MVTFTTVKHCIYGTILAGVVGATALLNQASAQAANLDQIRNGTPASPTDPAEWVNGNAGESNAHYAEGHSIAYRLRMTDLPPNVTITLRLKYNIKHSGKHALDYLTHFNRLLPHAFTYTTKNPPATVAHTTPEVIDPTIGTPFAGQLASPTDLLDILAPGSTNSPVSGQPTTSFNNLQPAAQKQMAIWGADFVDGSYAYVNQGDLSAAASEAIIRLSFTTPNTPGLKTVLLAWGGHIASQVDWGSVNGVPRSAAGISGSPYHMALESWGINNTGVQDGSLPNLGNTDRSLAAKAVSPPPPCTIDNPSFNACPGGTATYTGPSGTGLIYLWTVSPSTVAVIDGATPASGATTSTAQSITVNHLACGSYSVTLRVTQQDGQFLECTANKSVSDNTAPVFTNCPANTSVQCLEDVPPVPTVTATDNCTTPTVVYNGQTSSGTCPTIITRTWTATDACGNSSTCTQTITVDDTQKPTITCPAPVSVQCIEDVPAADITLVTASDNCSTPTIQWLGDVPAGTCPTIITRTYQATDDCGNTETCTQTITVDDTQAPVFTNCPADITVASLSAVPAAAIDIATDNCGTPTISSSDATNTQNCYTVITRTYTATDDCGNTATCTQQIFVIDRVAPTVTCNANPAALNCGDPIPVPTATDNSGGTVAHFYSDNIQGAADACQDFIRTWTFIDPSGNTATCVQNITFNLPTLARVQSGTRESEPQQPVQQKTSSARKLTATQELGVQAYPNPYFSSVTFKFTAPQSGKATLEVYDLMGRRLAIVYQGNLQAGEQKSVTYKIPAVHRAPMIYKLSLGDKSSHGKLLPDANTPNEPQP